MAYVLLGVYLVQACAAGVHRHYIAYNAALGKQQQAVVSHRVGCLYGIQQHNTLLGGKRLKLAPLFGAQRYRRLAQHVLATLQRLLYLAVVQLGCRDDVQGIRRRKQLVVRGGMACLVLKASGKEAVVECIHLARLEPVDKLALTLYLVEYGRFAHKSERNRLLLAAYLGARHSVGALEVYHTTIVVEIVELALPVGSYGEYVDTKPLDVVYLLTLVLLNNNLVGKSGGLHSLNSLHKRLLHVNLATLAVERVGRHSNDEIVAKSLGSLQQSDVSIM